MTRRRQPGPSFCSSSRARWASRLPGGLRAGDARADLSPEVRRLPGRRATRRDVCGAGVGTGGGPARPDGRRRAAVGVARGARWGRRAGSRGQRRWSSRTARVAPRDNCACPSGQPRLPRRPTLEGLGSEHAGPAGPLPMPRGTAAPGSRSDARRTRGPGGRPSAANPTGRRAPPRRPCGRPRAPRRRAPQALDADRLVLPPGRFIPGAFSRRWTGAVRTAGSYRTSSPVRFLRRASRAKKARLPAMPSAVSATPKSKVRGQHRTWTRW